jgi:hypothetical protein
MANLMIVVAVVADKALADEIYHVGQENTSLTPIFLDTPGKYTPTPVYGTR